MTNPTTGRRWRVKTTAYYGTPHVSQARNSRERAEFRMEGGPRTAVGDRVGFGDIAVPSHVPLGTKFWIPGYGWGVARDHGGGIKGNHIDLAHGGVVNGRVNPEARSAAQQWGARNQTVYVFPPSYQIPADRKPPQAYINDVNNKKASTPQTQVAQTALPSRGTASHQPQKQHKAVKTDGNFKPIPMAHPEQAPLQLKSVSPDEINWANFVGGWDKNHPEDHKLTMGDRGVKAYERMMENSYSRSHDTADQWDEGRKEITDILNRAGYQSYKHRLNSSQMESLNNIAARLTGSLTPDNPSGIQPNMHRENEYRRGEVNPIAQAEWPKPIDMSSFQPAEHESQIPTAPSTQASVPHHQVDPTSPIDRMIMDHFANRQPSMYGRGPSTTNTQVVNDNTPEPIASNESKSMNGQSATKRPDPVLSIPNNEPMITQPSYSNRLQNPEVNISPSNSAPIEPKTQANATTDNDDLLTAIKNDVHNNGPRKPEPHSQEAKMGHYLRKINETDRLKGPDGNLQKAMHHFNELRKLLQNDKTLDDASRRKLIATQGNYPYRSNKE